MKIWDVSQGSEEWLALRKSYFTGSALGEWLLDGDRTKTSRKARSNAIWSKLGELSQDDEPNFPNWAMKRGTELEPLARAAYERHTGFKVREVGFISHDSDGFGVSPDGLIVGSLDFPIGDDDFYHGLELKCPVARTMLKWLDAGTLPDEHDYSAAKAKLAGWIATPTNDTP